MRLVLMLSLAFLILEFAVIHDSANGWIGIWGNANKVQTGVSCFGQRFFGRDDSELISFLIYDSHRRFSNLIIDDIAVFLLRSTVSTVCDFMVSF